jgi:hypothetical protein
MNWSKMSAIVGFIVLLLVGIHTAMGIHDRMNGKKPTE